MEIMFTNETNNLLNDRQFLSFIGEVKDFLTREAILIADKNLYIGTRCFDVTLGKPIWWNGTNWIDSTGTSV